MNLKVEYVKTGDLKAYEANAKLHPKEQVEQIVKSIEQFGFNDPLAVDENGMIIEGHGRLLAAKQIGMKEVPIIRLEGLTDEQKRAYTLVHNKLTLNSGFDIDILNAELDSIADINMEDFGFDLTLPDGYDEDLLKEYEGLGDSLLVGGRIILTYRQEQEPEIRAFLKLEDGEKLNVAYSWDSVMKHD